MYNLPDVYNSMICTEDINGGMILSAFWKDHPAATVFELKEVKPEQDESEDCQNWPFADSSQ